MNRVALSGLILLAVVSTAISLRAGLVLNGVTVLRDQPSFSLYSEEDKTNAWIFLGQNFSGYTAVAFDPKTEVLTLEKNQVRTEIHLQGSSVQPLGPGDMRARIRGLRGLTLAYELARQGNQELADKLMLYHRIVIRLEEATNSLNKKPARQHEEETTNTAIIFLREQAADKRLQVEKAAETAALRLLADPEKK